MTGTVLLTGGTGFVGRVVAKRLAAAFERVVCLHRRAATLPAVDNVTVRSWEPGDLAQGVQGPIRVVVHLAAGGVAPGTHDTRYLIESNVVLTAHVIEAAARLGATTFIHAGSWSELPSLRSALGGDEPVSEYGAAKAAATMVAQALGQRLGLTCIDLRLFNVYGPGEAPHRLIPFLVGAWREGRVPDLTSCTQQRDFVYVDDLADAVVRAATADWQAGERGVFDVCTGSSVPVRRVVEEVCGALDAPGLLEGLGRRPARAGEPPVITGDPGPLARRIGWRATTPLAEGVRHTVQALVQE